MKKLYFLMILAGLCVLTMQSCKKSSSSPVTGSGSLSLTYNGTAYTFTSVTAKYNKSQGLMLIAGTHSPATISIGLLDTMKTGTYSVDNDQNITFAPDADQHHACLFDAGTITVTSFTGNTIAGTFNATGTDLAGNAGTLTQGKFQLTYTSQN